MKRAASKNSPQTRSRQSDIEASISEESSGEEQEELEMNQFSPSRESSAVADEGWHAKRNAPWRGSAGPRTRSQVRTRSSDNARS
eukprot:764496-Hanusia_phi.AAC.2